MRGGTGGGLPELRIPATARRDRLTGSHVYGHASCEHRVWLDFFGDPERKLAASESMQRRLERGRQHEARVLEALGWPQPDYPTGEYENGAARTLDLLRAGVPGVAQGVLLELPYLGVPDLLRRVEGESALGTWHYEVGDVKSSLRPRADQVLQVAFYSLLLGEVQGRPPASGYLVLADGSEERVDVQALHAVLLETIEEIDALLNDASGSRPHRSLACRDCAWRAVCGEREDVYWIPGLTRAARARIDALGYRSLDALQVAEPRALARRHDLPEATWQRAKWGAQALVAHRAIQVRPPRGQDLVEPVAVATVVREPMRLRGFAWQVAGAAPGLELAASPDDEPRALAAMLRALRGRGSVGHAGALPGVVHGLVQRNPELAEASSALEARCVDLASLARGTWVFPAPVASCAEMLAWLRGVEPDGTDDLLLEAADAEVAAAAEAQLGDLRALLAALSSAAAARPARRSVRLAAGGR